MANDWQRIDLTVVPGIAFDRRGQRINYGAGYYDRLLSHLRARRVGCALRASCAMTFPPIHMTKACIGLSPNSPFTQEKHHDLRAHISLSQRAKRFSSRI